MNKKHPYLYVLYLFLIIILAAICLINISSGDKNIHNFSLNTYPVSADLPLPVPSQITADKNNIRLDLEKIAVNKYYIIYSVIYGDQSHTAYHLYLTDLKRRKLKVESIKDIYLVDKNNNHIFPSAEKAVITEFPEDQPLGWKLGLIVKFPYSKTKESHSLILNYNESSFELKDISY